MLNENVLAYRQVGDQVQFLHHHPDAQTTGFALVAWGIGRTDQGHAPGVGPNQAGHHPAQRALARPVLPHQCMNLAR